jgi:hypothetical protein
VAAPIFKSTGFEASILATAGIGVINVFMAVVGMNLIDRVGLKPLLPSGLVGMG